MAFPGSSSPRHWGLPCRLAGLQGTGLQVVVLLGAVLLVAVLLAGHLPGQQQVSPQLAPARSLCRFQAEEPNPGIPAEQAQGHRISAVRSVDGLIRSLTWTPPEGEPVAVPMPVSVPHCEPTLSPDGGLLLVLAGGIRTPLELLLAQKTGRVTRISTGRGRRLPESGAAGLGSRPWTDGAHVAVFAFSTDNGTEIRAVDLEGRQLGARTLPRGSGAGAIQYTAAFDPERWQVVVSTPGDAEPLRIAHPLAPRPVLDPPRLQFSDVLVGRSSSRSFGVRNTGRRPLQLICKPEGGGQSPLQVTAPGRITVPPGGLGYLQVGFRPTAPGPWEGAVILATNSPDGDIKVPVGGAGLAPTPPPVDPNAGDTTAPDAMSEPEPARPVQPDTVPAAPAVRSLWWRPRPGGGVYLHGLLQEPTSTAPLDVVLLVVPAPMPGGGATMVHPGASSGPGNRYPPPEIVPLQASGAFQAEMPDLSGGESLRILLQYRLPEGAQENPLRSTWTDAGRVGPWLASAPGALEIHGRPGLEVLLLQMAGAPGTALGAMPRRSWRIRLDRNGRVRLDGASLAVGGAGQRPENGWFTALDDAGLWAASRYVRF